MTIQEIRKVLDSHYKFEQLKFIVDKHVKGFVFNHLEIAARYPVLDKYYNQLKKKKPFKSKAKYVEVYAECLRKEVFVHLFQELPEKVKKMWELLIWNPVLSSKVFSERFAIDTVNNSGWSKPLPFTHFFIPERQRTFFLSANPIYFFRLPFSIRKYLNTCFIRPESLTIKVVEPEKTDFVFTNEGGVLKDLSLLVGLDAQGAIKLTKKGVLHATSIKKIEKALQLKRFYPWGDDPMTDYTRATLAGYLIAMLPSDLKQAEPEDTLKLIFAFFVSNNLWLHYIYYYFEKFHDTNVYSIGENYVALLYTLPIDKWIDSKLIANVLRSESEIFVPLDADDLRYESTFMHFQNGKKKKSYLWKLDDPKYLVEQYGIYAMFFVLASLGIVEIAYDRPAKALEKPWGDIHTHEDYKLYGPFDMLRYIRLTRLGAYLLGRIDNYNFSSFKKEEGKIRLDESQLLIHVEESVGNVKRHVLSELAVPINQVHYKVTFGSFLKGCRDMPAVLSKLEKFKSVVGNKWPKNWEAFEKELKTRNQLINRVEEAKVYRLESQPELLQTIVNDPTLRKLILKAEDYHVVVLPENHRGFLKRIRDLGYFLG